ncbi:MAG: FtsX-like permease family protein [Phycisphaerae bacterium]
MSLPLKYHWRNLFVRKTTTTLTILVVGAVVGTLTWILGFYFALQGSLAVAADDRKIIVLQRGANSETNSAISPEEFNRLSQLGDVAQDAQGRPLISPELYWQTQLSRVRDGGKTRANVALRGVTEIAFAVHRNVHPLGATFSTGAPEVIAGVAAAKQFQGLNVGDTIRLGFGDNRDYKVVGHFSADGGPMETEIWAYLPSMQSAYSRNGYSSVSMRLRDGADPRASIGQISGAAIQLGAMTERGYWQSQSTNVLVYQLVCSVLVAMMALAAVFAVANTMFAAVAGRSREIAMLRTIGYSPGQIKWGFVLEAVMLTLLGGGLGCLGCWLWLNFVGYTKDMFGANTFTTMAFEIHLTPMIVAIALLGVTLIGAAGAYAPARRAAGLEVIGALREG